MNQFFQVNDMVSVKEDQTTIIQGVVRDRTESFLRVFGKSGDCLVDEWFPINAPKKGIRILKHNQKPGKELLELLEWKI